MREGLENTWNSRRRKTEKEINHQNIYYPRQPHRGAEEKNETIHLQLVCLLSLGRGSDIIVDTIICMCS